MRNNGRIQVSIIGHYCGLSSKDWLRLRVLLSNRGLMLINLKKNHSMLSEVNAELKKSLFCGSTLMIYGRNDINLSEFILEVKKILLEFPEVIVLSCFIDGKLYFLDDLDKVRQTFVDSGGDQSLISLLKGRSFNNYLLNNLRFIFRGYKNLFIEKEQ